MTGEALQNVRSPGLQEIKPQYIYPKAMVRCHGVRWVLEQNSQKANHSFLPTSPPHNSESRALLLALGEDEGALVYVYSTNTCYMTKHVC